VEGRGRSEWWEDFLGGGLFEEERDGWMIGWGRVRRGVEIEVEVEVEEKLR
jgi:hypothetical protein